MNSDVVLKKMTEALGLAKQVWEEAEMPLIYPQRADETGKIALAILASKIYDQLDDPKDNDSAFHFGIKRRGE